MAEPLRNYVSIVYHRRKKDGKVDTVRITVPLEWAEVLGILDKMPKRVLAELDVDKKELRIRFE